MDRIVSPPMLLLAVTAIMLYAASRAASEALGEGGRGGAIARAFGHSLPIGLTAMAAIGARLDSLAVGVLFASSVMCLTLVAGVALLSAPLDEPAEGRHAWGLMLPIAILCLIAGLVGGVSLQLALGFAVLGGTMAWTWRGEVPAAWLAEPTPRGKRFVLLTLSVILAAMAAVAVTWAVSRIGVTHRILSVGMMAGTVIAPLLALPLVGAASERAYREKSSASSMSIALATVAFNLCLWMPVITVLRVWREWAGGSLQTSPLPIPLGVWRVDAVLLVAAGLLLVPIGMRRWTPARLEGGVLVATYVLFVVLMATSGWR